MFLTTKKLEELKNLWDKGLSNKYTKYFYQNHVGNRKGNIKFHFTAEELEEYGKCSNSIEYFIDTYLDIKLRDYQIEAIKHFQENRFSIFCVSRQTGMTSIFVLCILHYLLFNSNKNVLIFDNINAMKIERSDKFMYYYRQVPFFLQKGLEVNNFKSKKFDNGSRLFFHNSTNIGIGFKPDITIFFDFPYYTKLNIDRLYKKLIPTLTSYTDNKIIIEGRPNGNTLFNKILIDSDRVEGDPAKNIYKSFRAYWWQVKGRDLEWREKIINMIGQESWDKEYDLRFIVKN